MQNSIRVSTNLVDRSVFKKDILDKIKLKNRKRAWHQNPESKDKIVTLFKITN